MLHQVDKMAYWQNGKLTKFHGSTCYVTVIVLKEDVKLMQHQCDKMACWQNSKLKKCAVPLLMPL
jgi:hypothetical protein